MYGKITKFTIIAVKNRDRHLPSKTVSSGDHPRAVHQDPSTHQTTIQLEVDQPGPAARRSRRASHNPRARLCDVLHCGCPLTTHCCWDRQTLMVKKNLLSVDRH